MPEFLQPFDSQIHICVPICDERCAMSQKHHYFSNAVKQIIRDSHPALHWGSLFNVNSHTTININCCSFTVCVINNLNHSSSTL